jgi:hypothetical protein
MSTVVRAPSRSLKNNETGNICIENGLALDKKEHEQGSQTTLIKPQTASFVGLTLL